MLPYIDMGSFHINLYFGFNVLAVVVAGSLAVRRLTRPGYPWYWPVQGMALTILAGVWGTGLFWKLLQLMELLFTGSTARFGERVYTIIGGILFGALAGIAYCRYRKYPIGDAFDRGIPAMPLGQAIGRLGCLFGGCCSGRVTDSWLGISLPGATGIWADRYPTQLLSSLVNFAIFGILLTVERRMGGVEGAREKGWLPGYLTLVYVFLYFSKRFAMEFIRAERPLVWGPFTWAHVASAIGLAVAAGLWAFHRKRLAMVMNSRHRPS